MVKSIDKGIKMAKERENFAEVSSNAAVAVKRTKRGFILSPEKMREISLAENASIRKFAEEKGWGKKPSTFPEVTR